MQALVNRDFPEPLTNKDVLEIKIVEQAIDSLPRDLKVEYNNLDTSRKDSIKKKLKNKVSKMKKQKYVDTEIMSSLDRTLANELDM